MVKLLAVYVRVLSLFLLMLLLASSFYAAPAVPNHPIMFKVAPPPATTFYAGADIVADTTSTITTALASTKSAPPVQIGDEYLALGDSVAYGVGAPTPNTLGYAGQFYDNYLRRVQPHLATYKDFGVPGETSSSFLEGPHGLSQMQRALNEVDAAKAANHRISPITLTIGGNDMLDARNQNQTGKDAVLARYDTNLQRILDNLKLHTGGQSDVIVTTYFNPYGGPNAQEDDVTWIQRFNALIKQRAQEHGFKTADFYTPILSNESSLTWANYGDVHPNSQGYAKLARAIWQATGYDTTPPDVQMLYSNLPTTTGAVQVGQRFAFKLNVQDNWNIGTGLGAGAGTIWEATVSLDDGAKQILAAVPTRFINGPAGSQQYSYILDTSNLNAGAHILHFGATDAAGNFQALNLDFDIAS